MSSKVWDEIIHSPLKCGEWISHIIPQFIMDIITYPCWNLSLSMLVRGPLVENYVIKGAYSTIQLKLMAAFLSPIRQLNFSHSSGWQKGYFLVMGTTLPVGRREIVILFHGNVISIQHSSFSPKYPSTHPTFENLTFNLFFGIYVIFAKFITCGIVPCYNKYDLIVWYYDAIAWKHFHPY